MMFEIKDKDLAGRIGIIKTKHGKIETPYLFPVINPRKQDVNLQELKSMGFPAIITNAWLINRYYNSEAIKRKLHSLLNFNGPIMTDSGAYQELHYGYVDADPIEIVRFQIEIGSDIAVILDKPTQSNASFEDALESVEETHNRALKAIKYIKESDILWVYPIQGAPYIDAVRRAIDHALEPLIYNAFSLYAIGSPTKLLERYDYATIIRVVAEAKMRLPLDKPIHLFGAGHPMIIPFMVALGIDTFDSASYILYARDERLMTPRGTIRLQEIDYLPCVCPICSKYTVKELKELDKKTRIKLIAQHNLYVINQELRTVKQAIREGRLWELLEERARSHPSLYDAFRVLIKYKQYIEKLSPTFKSLSRGIFLYDSLSSNRPHILRHRRRLLRVYVPYADKIVLLPLNARIKKNISHYIETKINKIFGGKRNGFFEIIFYAPFFNLIPLSIIDVYPLFQFEIPENLSNNVIDDILRYLQEFLAKLNNMNRKFEVYMVSDRDIYWSLNVVKTIEKNLQLYKYNNVEIIMVK